MRLKIPLRAFPGLTCLFLTQGLEYFRSGFQSWVFTPCSLAPLSGTPMMQMLTCLMSSQQSLKLHFGFIFCRSYWMFSATLSSKSPILSFVSCDLLWFHQRFFISVAIFFIPPCYLPWFSLLVSVLAELICSSPKFIEHHYNQCFERCIW